MASINALVNKLTAAIEKYGNEYSYKRSGFTYSTKGLLSVAPYGTLYGWFLASDASSWDRPSFQLVIAGDFTTSNGGPVAGDTVALPDVTDEGTGASTVDYEVRKIFKLRLGGEVLYTRLYLAKDAPP